MHAVQKSGGHPLSTPSCTPRTPPPPCTRRRFALEAELRREGLPEDEQLKIMGELSSFGSFVPCVLLSVFCCGGVPLWSVGVQIDGGSDGSAMRAALHKKPLLVPYSTHASGLPLTKPVRCCAAQRQKAACLLVVCCLHHTLDLIHDSVRPPLPPAQKNTTHPPVLCLLVVCCLLHALGSKHNSVRPPLAQKKYSHNSPLTVTVCAVWFVCCRQASWRSGRATSLGCSGRGCLRMTLSR